MFRLLINTVSGIGPKIALNILSGMNVTALRGAVAQADIKSLSSISGVGRKTAERIIVELKDKIGPAGAWEAISAQRALSPGDQKMNDAVLALIALGFKQVEAHEAAVQALDTAVVGATVDHADNRTRWLALDGTVTIAERREASIVIAHGVPLRLVDVVQGQLWTATAVAPTLVTK